MSTLSKNDISTITKAFIDNVLALMPSRSRIMQFIMMLPMNENDAKELFPEFFKDPEAWEFFKEALGIDVDEDMNLIVKKGSLAEALQAFIATIFSLLSDVSRRGAFSALVGNIVPDPHKEWVRIRIESILKDEELGNYARQIFALLAEKKVMTIDELVASLKIDRTLFDKLVYIMKLLKIIIVRDDRVELSEEIKKYYRHLITILTR